MSNIEVFPAGTFPGLPNDFEDDINGPLDPCPSCGSRPFEAPEGVHDVHSVKHHPGTSPGDPKWNFEHCWKCGHRPGHNVAISQNELSRQFAAFKAWMNDQLPATDRGIAPPASSDEVNSLKAALEEAQKREAILREQLGVGNGDKTE